MAPGIPARLSASQARAFGLTVGPAFVLLGGVLLWRDHPSAASAAATLGGVLILAAVAAPEVLVPVERVWMRFAHAISTVTTPIVMAVIYFLVLAPIGMLLRLFRRNPLRRARTHGGFWVLREPERGQRGGMDRQF